MLLGIIILLIIALIPANIAKNKGKNFWIWYAYGIALWIVALIHAVSLNDKSSNKNTESKIKEEQIDIQQTSFNMPVFVRGYRIVEIDGDYYLKINVKNIYHKALKAVRCDIIGKDAFKKEIPIEGKYSFEITIQDIDVFSGDQQIICNNIPLPNKAIRIVEIHIKEALFEGGELIKAQKREFKDTLIPLLDDEINAARKIYQQSSYYPKEYVDYWVCSCGYRNDTDQCKNCNANKEKILEYFEEKNLHSEVVNTKERIEKQRQIEKRKRKSTIIISSVVVVLIGVICWYVTGRLAYVFPGEWKFYYYNESYDTYNAVSASKDTLYLQIYNNGELLASKEFEYEIGKNESEKYVIYQINDDGSKSEWMIIDHYDRDSLLFENPRSEESGYAFKQ